VVDGTGLENRHTLTGIGGSNPSLSASYNSHANSRLQHDTMSETVRKHCHSAAFIDSPVSQT
jgi:hypothetical protein